MRQMSVPLWYFFSISSIADTIRESKETENRTLDSEIEQYDLSFLASYFDNVEYYLDVFELSPAEQTDVRNMIPQGTQIAMTKCLSTWRTHNPESATFRVLLSILEGLKKEAIAYKIMKYLKLTG